MRLMSAQPATGPIAISTTLPTAMPVSPHAVSSFHQPIPTLQRDGDAIIVLDQTLLPFRSETRRLTRVREVATAIRGMQVRGAPLIGATAAFGVAIALATDGTADAVLDEALTLLGATRPTAVNLHWALARMAAVLRPIAAGRASSSSWPPGTTPC